MDLLKGGAIFAVIAGFWKNIKSVMALFASTIVQKDEIRSDQLYAEMIGYLVRSNKYYKNYSKVYDAQFESFRNGKYGLVPFEKYGENRMIFLTSKRYFFKMLRLPIIVTKQNINISTSSASTEAENQSKKIVYVFSIKGTFNLSSLIAQTVQIKNSESWNLEELIEDKSRFNLFFFPKRDTKEDSKQGVLQNYTWFYEKNINLLGVSDKDLGREFKSKGDALEKLYFNDEVVDLINLVRVWINSANWYKDRNIPWKLGWLLYGKPGTGKTALTRAFAETLDIPIYSFSLAQLSNEEFISSWQSMQLNTPCIALIEDIDNVFDKRENITLKHIQRNFQVSSAGSNDTTRNLSPLTFDTLINCIDGVDKTDGVFTIITTNDISKIDEAIGIPNQSHENVNFSSTRPGRIDKAIELGFMNESNKRKMALKIVGEFPNALVEIENHIKLNLNETPAQFQNICTQLALKEFWLNV